MPRNALPELRCGVGWIDDLNGLDDPRRAWLLVMLARYQINNLPPLPTSKALRRACGMPADWTEDDFDWVMSQLEPSDGGGVGLSWVQNDKKKAARLSATRAMVGALGGKMKREKSQDMQIRQRQIQEGRAGVAIAKQLPPDEAPQFSTVVAIATAIADKPETGKATRAPAPALPSLGATVAGGEHAAGGLPRPSPTSALPPSPSPAAFGPSSQRAFRCGVCEQDRTMLARDAALGWPCPVCGANMEPLQAARKEAVNVKEVDPRDRLSVPAVLGPRGVLVEKPGPVESKVRKVQRVHAQPSPAVKKSSQTGTHKAPGRIAAKAVTPQHGGKAKRPGGSGRNRRK